MSESPFVSHSKAPLAAAEQTQISLVASAKSGVPFSGPISMH